VLLQWVADGMPQLIDLDKTIAVLVERFEEPIDLVQGDINDPEHGDRPAELLLSPFPVTIQVPLTEEVEHLAVAGRQSALDLLLESNLLHALYFLGV
jgi:hypothetical protein